MAVNIFALNITVIMHDEYTIYWDSPGLYCRTHISV